MLKFLVEKEFKRIFRNPFLPRFIVAFPFMVLLVFPLAASFEVKNIQVVIVDNDRGPCARRLVEKVAASAYFRFAGVERSYAEGLRRVELGEADVVLEIPAAFERDLLRDKRASALISADAVNAVKGGLGSAYLSGILNDFSAELRGELSGAPDRPAVPSFEIVPRYRFNPHLRYPVFMVPALMVMIITMFCGFLPALNIVGEKESGTIEQMNVTPVRRFDFILSKLIPYWVIGFVVLTICFGVAFFAYGLFPGFGIFTIYLFASVFVLAMSGFGLVISNYANTIQQAMFMMFFFVMALIFLSGLYTPVESMPDWAQAISDFSPLKYFIRTMRLVYLKGSGFPEMVGSFAALCGFAAFFNVWAVLSYRKSA